MISAHLMTLAFLGRRYKPHCDRCKVDLPGRFAEERDALHAGLLHVAQRHVNRTTIEGDRAA